ncbi:hypothetical protein Hypma_005075 [Hypsizygus marmoreus]|uniref:Uncharacterized protein n=1 Tax=Hypsizygus marmoreus TaxID=39966 RepID=A0A369K2M7_HYPMA|nr:hypothetical protein Hypma_005075 [Hypsizygus marmoreus]
MYIPILSSISKHLERRKGGGGGGGGGGHGSSGKGGGKSSGGKGSSGSKTIPAVVPWMKSPAVSYGQGGGHPIVIPNGALFAGRTAGGGNRTTVYGTKRYGSGYPGISGSRVQDRGFPYIFWPVIWTSLFIGSATYLYSNEFGLPGNLDRPGGIMMNAAFKSGVTGTVYRVVADNATVVALCQEISAKCSGSIADSNSAPVADSGDASQAKPEQAVQYYRASSVVLTLDGYNNSAIFASDDTPDVALPSNIDTQLLSCMNDTIGQAVPLVDFAPVRMPFPKIVPLLGVIVALIYMIDDL